MVPLYRETRDCTKQIRLAPMARQMFDRLGNEQARLLSRPLLAQQRNECGLAGAGVASGRLARRRRVPAMVDEVVGDLEGEADVARVATVRPPRLGRKLGHDR